MIDLRKIIFVWVVFAVLLLHHPSFLSAAPFGLNGNWRYSRSGGEVEEEDWSFTQSYNLSVSKDMSAGMNFSGSVRYNDRTQDQGDDSSSVTSSASWDVRNDLFSFVLSGSGGKSETSGRPELTNKSWNVNWMSLLENVPKLRLNYGQSFNYDDQSPRMQDIETSFLTANLSHNWSIFDFSYDFRTNSSTNNVSDITTDTDQHFARIKLTKAFLRNRMNVSASQQYSQSESETESRVGVGNEFFVPLNRLGLEAFSGTLDDPLLGELDPNSALIDGEKTISAGVEIAKATDEQSLALRVFSQPVSRIRVYLDDEISSATQNFFTWRVYTSTNGLNWVLNSQPAADYSVEFGRTVVQFDLPSTVTVNYVKVVVESTGGITAPEVNVTEMEAGTVEIADAPKVVKSSKYTSCQTRLNVSYRPTSRWSLGYSVTRDVREPDSNLDSTQLAQSVSSSYVLNRYFSTSLGVNENKNKTDGQDEQKTRSYSATISSALLPTLDLSAGYTRSESFEASTRQTTTDSVNAYMSALLFPDLSTTLTTNWTDSKNEQTGTATTNYGYRFTGAMRFSPRLNIDVNYNYAHSEQDSDVEDADTGSSSSRQYGLDLSYRPSDILLLRSSLSRDEEEGTTAFSGNVSWKMTRKIQANGVCRLDIEGGDAEDYTLSLNWSISRHFTFRTSASYVVANNVDSWDMFARLTATF